MLDEAKSELDCVCWVLLSHAGALSEVPQAQANLTAGPGEYWWVGGGGVWGWFGTAGCQYWQCMTGGGY
jgi:hypothetical protein